MLSCDKAIRLFVLIYKNVKYFGSMQESARKADPAQFSELYGATHPT